MSYIIWSTDVEFECKWELNKVTKYNNMLLVQLKIINVDYFTWVIVPTDRLLNII